MNELSRFRPRVRPDPLGEEFTNADALIGHFDFHESSRAGLRLREGASQFVVVEAKMLSNLSKGTKNARAYNQAACNVACMAEAVAHAGQPIEASGPLGFFVIAPERSGRRASQRLIDTAVSPASICEAVRTRVRLYRAAGRPESHELEARERATLAPMLDQMSAPGALGVLSWESCIERVAREDRNCEAELADFYERALELATFQPGAPEAAP